MGIHIFTIKRFEIVVGPTVINGTKTIFFLPEYTDEKRLFLRIRVYLKGRFFIEKGSALWYNKRRKAVIL
jgi:hypothetical protein